jgi:hypothetical protein
VEWGRLHGSATKLKTVHQGEKVSQVNKILKILKKPQAGYKKNADPKTQDRRRSYNRMDCLLFIWKYPEPRKSVPLPIFRR